MMSSWYIYINSRVFKVESGGLSIIPPLRGGSTSQTSKPLFYPSRILQVFQGFDRTSPSPAMPASRWDVRIIRIVVYLQNREIVSLEKRGDLEGALYGGIAH